MYSKPTPFRTGALLVLLIAAGQASVTKALAPQYVLHERVSRATVYLFFPYLLMYLCYRWYVYPKVLSPYRHLPGPEDRWLIQGNGRAQVSKPPGQEMLQWINTIPNDGLLKFRHFGEHRLIPTSPAMLKALLSDHVYDWQKPQRVISFLGRILGLGLILAEGDAHKHQRKHLLPAFQVKVIRGLYPLFWRKGRQMVKAIQAECGPSDDPEVKRLEFNDWTTRVTLDIIGVAGFGRDFNAVNNEKDDLVENYEQLLDPHLSNVIYFGASMVFPQSFVNLVLPHKDRRLRKIMKIVSEYALDLIRTRREQLKGTGNGDETRVDILTQIVKSNVFSDQEIVDQVLTMLAAGHETTSSALTWVAYLLSVNPAAQSSLREEIRAKIPSLDSEIDHQLIESLPYLNAVCSETLRLYPTVPITVREAIRDTMMGDVMISQGTSLLISPWAINRSKQFWGEDAEEFRPERWLEPGTAKTGGATTNYANITFLHGSRSCVGRDFAQSELKCLVAALVGRYEIELDMPRDRVWPAGVVTTKPKNGMYLKLRVVDGW